MQSVTTFILADGSTRLLRVLLVGRRSGSASCSNSLPGASLPPGTTRTCRHCHGPRHGVRGNVVRQPFPMLMLARTRPCAWSAYQYVLGFGWKAIPQALERAGRGAGVRSAVSCVDTRKARHQIAESFKKFRAPHIISISATTPPAAVCSWPRGSGGVAHAQENRLPTVSSSTQRLLTRRSGKLASKLFGRGGVGSAGAVHQSDPGRQLARHARPITAIRSDLISRRLYNAETGRLAPLPVDPVQLPRCGDCKETDIKKRGAARHAAA